MSFNDKLAKFAAKFLPSNSGKVLMFDTSGEVSVSDSSFMFRNRIMNGNMKIDQRNNGAAVSINSEPVYTIDRWVGNKNGSSINNFSIQRNQNSIITPAGFKNYIGILTGTSSAVAANDYAFIQQGIEGNNIEDFSLGTANAKAFTLSFWVYCSTAGTFGISFRNVNGTRSYIASYSINQANIWEYKTITVQGDTSGTWATDNTAGLRIGFEIGVGSNFSNAPGSWITGNYLGLTGGTKLTSISGATLCITGVQLEIGSIATPFEHRPYGLELTLCQRYYEKSYAVEVVPGTASSGGYLTGTGGGSGSRASGDARYIVQKRTIPAISIWDYAGTANNYSQRYNSGWSNGIGTVTVIDSSDSGFGMDRSNDSIGWVIHFAANAEL